MHNKGPTTYKLHHQGQTDDFIIFVANQEAVQKWRADRTSISLTDVVDSYQVFITRRQGSQGLLDHAPNGSMDQEFGTHNVEKVVEKILETGRLETGEMKEKSGNTNLTEGSYVAQGFGGTPANWSSKTH